MSDESSDVAQTCVKHMRTPVACGTKSMSCRKVYQAYGTGTEFTGSTGGVKVDLKFIFCAHNLARVQNYKPSKVEASHSQKGNFKSVFVCHSGLELSAVKWSNVLFNSFKSYDYDPCIANCMVNGKQHTVRFHVDDSLSSHLDPKVNDRFAQWLEKMYGKYKAVDQLEARFMITWEWLFISRRKGRS